MPILAEVYNLGTPEYYAVAVVKIRDDDSELIYLKRRKSCHSGKQNKIIPMHILEKLLICQQEHAFLRVLQDISKLLIAHVSNVVLGVKHVRDQQNSV